MASVNGTGRREDKELTDSLHQDILWRLKATPFELPTGEGAPQGLRGWGVRLKWVWGRVPQWVWAKPKVCF
jgi:hypothetical protein